MIKSFHSFFVSKKVMNLYFEVFCLLTSPGEYVQTLVSLTTVVWLKKKHDLVFFPLRVTLASNFAWSNLSVVHFHMNDIVADIHGKLRIWMKIMEMSTFLMNIKLASDQQNDLCSWIWVTSQVQSTRLETHLKKGIWWVISLKAGQKQPPKLFHKKSVLENATKFTG